MDVLIRPMQLHDVPGVFDVQTRAYVSEMVEPEALIAQRWHTASQTAWVAIAQNRVCAYLMAYPSLVGKIAMLGQAFEPASQANALYLHDLAVDTVMAGQGIGVQLVQQAWDYMAQNEIECSCLVSVQSTKFFWERLGYAELAALSPDQIASLNSYTGPAYYLVRPSSCG